MPESVVRRGGIGLRAEQLELGLGDPNDTANIFNYRQQVECDEASELPEQAMSLMRKFGFPAFMIPASLGGALDRPEDVLWAGRVAARRDLTVTLSFGSTLLAAMPVWLWGTAEQRTRLAQALVSGSLGGFAISEAEHGSDLMASDAVLVSSAGKVFLSGAKWPIGNATRGDFITVLARSPGASGDGFSIVCLFKADLPADGWTNIPAVRLHGLRGFDLSGVKFSDCEIPPSAQIGRDGLKQTMKTLQVTRTMLATFSLGSGDSALRLALAHLRSRELYAKTAYDIPPIRRQLVGSYLDLLIAECVARPAFRAMSALPGRLSLWSAISKYLVPTLVEDVMADVGEILGARKFMREGPWYGMFQKLLRDNSVVSVFDGTTHVCVRAIAAQLSVVLERSPKGIDEAGDAMAAVFSFSKGAVRWEPDGEKLQLTNRGVDEVGQNWRHAVTMLGAGSSAAVTSTTAAAIELLVRELDEEWGALRKRVAGLRAADPAFASSAEMDDASRMFSLLWAASACLQTWLVNREETGGDFGAGDWLLGCLQRIMHRIRPFDHVQGLAAEADMLRRYDEGLMFSLEDFPIAR
ncbi:acyl-CoA dehydrogenase family protein [Paractinoplanes ferrugineus]|nr:acyl-CoA dehydrogenase family protein [Actinoplanes ferrugineus]